MKLSNVRKLLVNFLNGSKDYSIFKYLIIFLLFLKVYQNLEKKWFVAQVKRNSHELAARNLERQGFKTFIPKMKITKKQENKFIYRDVPVFPGYAFIGIDLQNSNWIKINSTYGVSKLLYFNNKPSEIPLDLIFALRHRYENNINLVTDQSLKKGDTIMFNNGPFADLIANIENLEEKERIYVLLKIMGGQRKLKINLKKKVSFIKI